MSKLDLKVEKQELGPCRLRLTLEIPADGVDVCLKKMTRKYNVQARVPGFRPGKCPKAILMSKFGKQIHGEALGTLLEDAVKQVVEDEKLNLVKPVSVLNEAELELKDSAPLKIDLDCELAPSFELPQYSGIEVQAEPVNVPDAEINNAIDSVFLSRRVNYETVDRAAAAGDLLKVSYKGVIQGGDQEIQEPAESSEETSQDSAEAGDEPAASEGNSFFLNAKETWLPLREPCYMPGAIEALVGVKAGETRQSEIKFADDFFEKELAGKTCDYTFEILEVQAMVKPELTDELAREFGAESADGLREAVREQLQHQKGAERDQGLREDLLKTMLDAVDFELPPSMYAEELAGRKERLTQERLERKKQAAGKTPEGDSVDASVELTGSEMAAVAEDAEKSSRLALKRHYLLEALVAAEGITLDPQEFNNIIASMAARHKMKEKEVLQQLRDSGRLNSLLVNMLHDKAMQRLLELADVKNIEPAATENPGTDAAESEPAAADNK